MNEDTTTTATAVDGSSSSSEENGKNDVSQEGVAKEEATAQDLWLGGGQGSADDGANKDPGDEEMPSLTNGEDDNDKMDIGDTSSNDDDDNLEFDSDTPLQKDPDELILEAVTLKEEGNAQFKSGDLTKASRSYRKGTTVLKPLNKKNTGDEQVKALLISLQTNLSMVCFKQNKPKVSRDVATKALEVEPTNVKALYRRAAALRQMGDIKEARADLKKALQQDPNNTAVKRELLSIKKELEKTNLEEKKRMQKAFSKSAGGSFLYQDKEQEQKQKEEAQKRKEQEEKEAIQKRKTEWEDECVQRMSNGQDAISFEDWDKQRIEREKALKDLQKQEEERKQKEQAKQKKALPKPKPPVQDDSSDDDDQLTEKELSMFRGYKKTTDGRTTSYFTKELSEHEKNLIGDITPQRLGDGSSPVPPAQIPPSTSADGGGVSATCAAGAPSGKGTASAWNQAGTWEEKDTTDWCTSHLKSLLTATTAADDDSSTTTTTRAVITSVETLTGDASVAITGGKKRYIFDFHATLKYEIRDDDRVDDVLLASGSLQLPDISSTAAHEIHELEVNVYNWQKSPNADCLEVATNCRTQLVQAVRSSVQCFVKDFNAHY